MYCPHCSERISELSEICLKCGGRVKEPETSVEDKSNIAVNILSLCCIPILGIVMFFVWKDTKPTAAKSALIFALVGIGISILWAILAMFLGFLFAVVDSTTYY